MTTWTGEELDKIAEAEELELASVGRDGTLRNPVTIWVVRVGDGLYVRAWRGRNSPWFRGAVGRHAGRIEAGGVEKDVTLVEETDPELNDRIDQAYRNKYGGYEAQYVDPMVGPGARAATLKLIVK